MEHLKKFVIIFYKNSALTTMCCVFAHILRQMKTLQLSKGGPTLQLGDLQICRPDSMLNQLCVAPRYITDS